MNKKKKSVNKKHRKTKLRLKALKVVSLKKKKKVVYTSLNKGIVSVSVYVEQSYFEVLNWKLPLCMCFPYVPIFKLRRQTNCENFGAGGCFNYGRFFFVSLISL